MDKRQLATGSQLHGHFEPMVNDEGQKAGPQPVKVASTIHLFVWKSSPDGPPLMPWCPKHIRFGKSKEGLLAGPSLTTSQSHAYQHIN